jgi:Ohr subfamily peroxiredoxin
MEWSIDRIDVLAKPFHRLSSPGSGKPGTNPEQLFGVGWSACFRGAIGLAAVAHKLKLPQDAAVDAALDLAKDDSGYFLQAHLKVSLPGVPRDTAKAIVDAAHQACPHSKATRGNIHVKIDLV